MSTEQEIIERSNSFRSDYRESTPSWYRGEYHLLFTLIFTVGVLFYSLSKISDSTLAQWCIMGIPMFLFGNWAEWAGHRYLLHNPKSLLKMAYKRHVSVHHVFFSHKTLDYHGQKDWRALLFPPFAPVLFVVAALPLAIAAGMFWTPNAGYIAMVVMSAYYLMYEALHTLSHIEHPLLDRLPVINSIRRMHILHHNPDFMHEFNFNLTFPICDALFGTSDLQKGVVGTLFQGNSDHGRKAEITVKLEQQKKT